MTDQPDPPLRTLDYEPPQKASDAEKDLVLVGLRRLAFALGLGLLCAGLGTVLADGRASDAMSLMGWGGGLIGLTVPMPWRPRLRV